MNLVTFNGQTAGCRSQLRT